MNGNKKVERKNKNTSERPSRILTVNTGIIWGILKKVRLWGKGKE